MEENRVNASIVEQNGDVMTHIIWNFMKEGPVPLFLKFRRCNLSNRYCVSSKRASFPSCKERIETPALKQVKPSPNGAAFTRPILLLKNFLPNLMVNIQRGCV